MRTFDPHTTPEELMASAGLSSRWYILFVLVVALLLLIGTAGCAPAHTDAAIDFDRVFHYGELQLEGERFVLVEQSLERNDRLHDLLVMPDVPDDRRLCFESGSKDHAETCATFGEVRKWVQSR